MSYAAVTHSKPSNWTAREHEVLKKALKKFNEKGRQSSSVLRRALKVAEKEGASKRVLRSIIDRASGR